jgi:hypothetical protein
MKSLKQKDEKEDDEDIAVLLRLPFNERKGGILFIRKYQYFTSFDDFYYSLSIESCPGLKWGGY